MDENTPDSYPTPPKMDADEHLRQLWAVKDRNLTTLNEHPLNQAALRRMQKEGLSPQEMNPTEPWASHLFLLAQHYLLGQPDTDPESEEAIELATVMESPLQQMRIIENLPENDNPESWEGIPSEEFLDTVMYHIRLRLGT